MNSTHPLAERTTFARRVPAVRLLIAAALVLAISPCQSQSQGSVASITGRISVAPDSLVVSLLTVGQGEELFNRFGHAAIRIRNPATGLDSAWNWGMFDFAAPKFLTRFLTGETQYWMAGSPSEWFIEGSRRAGRAMWEQDLALTRAESDSLLRLLRWNALEENKFYRYDYYLDNCSTRIRDVIDAISGGALRSAMSSDGGSVTWRSETLRLTRDFPFVGFGMTFALGPRADEVLSVWDEAFIPMRLRDAIRAASVARPGVGPVPLVQNERTLVPLGEFVEANSPPIFLGYGLLIGLGVAIVISLLGRSARASAAARLTVQGFGAAWHLALGAAGTLVLLAGLFTRHEFMAVNASILLGTPVSLALVVLYARAWSPRASERTRRAGEALAMFAAVAALLALLAHLVPSLGPRDWAPVALVLPVHIALALALRAHGRSRSAPTAARAQPQAW